MRVFKRVLSGNNTCFVLKNVYTPVRPELIEGSRDLHNCKNIFAEKVFKFFIFIKAILNFLIKLLDPSINSGRTGGVILSQFFLNQACVKIKKFVIFVLFIQVPIFAGILDYDIASYYGQNAKWDDAKEKLKKVFVDRSSDANVLYDLGVASFETKDFSQACEYFKAAAGSDNASSKIKEQANFNLGNTNFELKNLQDAVKNYEDVLKINPENLQAKHNLEVIKKMLGQPSYAKASEGMQEKKEQDKEKEQEQKSGPSYAKASEGMKENKEQKGNKENGKDGSEEDRKNKREQDKGNSDNGSKQAENKSGRKDESGQKDSKNEREGQKDSGQDGDSQKGDKKTEQNGQEKQKTNHDKNDKLEKEKEQEKQRDGKDTPSYAKATKGRQGEPGKEDRDKENRKEQEATGKRGEENREKQELGEQGKQDKSEKNGQDFGEQEQPLSAEIGQTEGAKKLDKRTVEILKAIDKVDKEKSKEFMRATVQENMSGKYGQNLW